MSIQPPNGLPIYRLISGPNDASFCKRVSEQLALGYQLHGSPAITMTDNQTVVCQAVIWPSPDTTLTSK